MSISILYTRVSSVDQKTDRQRVKENDFDKVIEDKCSGAIPIFERPEGSILKTLIDRQLIKSISVWQIDRCGRDLRDIINFIHYTTERGIPVTFLSQGLRTLDKDGKENPISKMIISILGVVSEMTRAQILENQRQGIELAKLDPNKYLGRKPGSVEDPIKFLSKKKNRLALDLLKNGYKNIEVAKIVGLHPNTITKVKRYL
jgi:DNA invertase Pin-like site-specific DNA recombinase